FRSGATELAEVMLISPAQSSILLSINGFVVPEIVAKLGSKTVARITGVLVKEGDQVRTGAPLAKLDDGSTVTAPIDGTIISKPRALGEAVAPTTGPIVELADLRSLVIEAELPEGGMSQVKPGTPCEVVLDAFPSKRYRCLAQEIGR